MRGAGLTRVVLVEGFVLRPVGVDKLNECDVLNSISQRPDLQVLLSEWLDIKDLSASCWETQLCVNTASDRQTQSLLVNCFHDLPRR